jgi:hypothetical protein
MMRMILFYVSVVIKISMSRLSGISEGGIRTLYAAGMSRVL